MSGTYVIFAATTGQPWHVARVTPRECSLASIEAVDGLQGLCKAAAEELRQLDYRGECTLLALPSPFCFCARVEDQGLRKAGREKGLLFRLEEQLPLAMEEVVADFIPGKDAALGIAATVQAVAPIVEALEKEGIAITNICPAAILIADSLRREIQDAGGLQLLLCALQNKLDLLVIEDGCIRGWRLLEPSIAPLQLQLRHFIHGRSEPLTVTGIGLPAEIQSWLSRENRIKLNTLPRERILEVAARCGDDVLNGRTRPPVELRRGALAPGDSLRQVRTPFRVMMAMAVVLSFSLAFSLFWRAWRYERLADDAQNRQLLAFQKAWPRQTPPPLIAARLLSEQKRLEGLSGTSGVLPPLLSVLPMVQAVLRGLPADVRFRLLELRFESERFYLDGQSLDHSSADRIAQSLRLSTGIQVDPPHTQEVFGEDVTFEISASAAQPDPRGAER